MCLLFADCPWDLICVTGTNKYDATCRITHHPCAGHCQQWHWYNCYAPQDSGHSRQTLDATRRDSQGDKGIHHWGPPEASYTLGEALIVNTCNISPKTYFCKADMSVWNGYNISINRESWKNVRANEGSRCWWKLNLIYLSSLISPPWSDPLCKSIIFDVIHTGAFRDPTPGPW